MYKDKAISYSSLLLLYLNAMTTTAASKPNILIIQADDLGYDDLSIHGNLVIETPDLDILSHHSVSFEKFYVQSVSAPSRASLLTGKDFWKTGVSGVHGGRDFIDLDEVLAPQVFKDNGYTTGMWGKWHSGKTEGYFPWNRGFDEAYMANLYQHFNNDGSFNGISTPMSGWTDSIMTNYAIDFITRNQNQPFLAYLSFLAPHGKWAANPSYIQKYVDKGLSQNFATLCAMIDHLSVQSGRVINKIDELGLRDNTIIIFLSDNGPAYNVDGNEISEEEWILRNPSYMRGNKSTNWENGIRSPLIISWKDKFRAHRDLNPVCINDILPTLFDLCGITQNSINCDGISLRNNLEDICYTAEERNIYIAQWSPMFFINGQRVNSPYLPLNSDNRAKIRFQDQVIGVHRSGMKYLLTHRQESPMALKNIISDPYEKFDFASQYGDLVASLHSSLENWFTNIYNSPNAFRMPRFVIDNKATCDVLAFAPLNHSNSLTNDAHSLNGWKKANDFAQYQIRVTKTGIYEIVLSAKNAAAAGAQFTVSAQGNSQIATITFSQSNKFELPLTEGDDILEIKLNNNQSSAFDMIGIQFNFLR
ncbi:arylsulfatase [Paludibacter sp.]